MFRFQSPYWLLLLLLIPLFLYLRSKRAVRPPIGVPSLRAVKEKIKPSFFVRTRWVVSALKVAAFILMTVAMARPQWGNREEVRLTEGINIVLAVDLSESMSALDFRLNKKTVTRLDAVKAVVKDFISKRDGDRIGLVVFGSQAYTQMPLTSDYNAVVSVLDRVSIGAAGKSTALGDAIGISLKRLQDIKSKANVIILLTDGRSNAGEMDPQTATDIAAKVGVKIYTVGVGTEGQVPFIINDPVWGRQVVYQKVDIDEATLKSIAEATGGLYFHADNSKGLKEIYETIDRLEKTEVKIKTYDNYNELYDRFLLPAFVLLLAAVLLANTRYLEAP